MNVILNSFRANESEEARESHLENDRLAKAEERRNHSPETARVRRKAATEGEQKRRENMSPEDIAIMNQRFADAKRKVAYHR